VVVGGNVNLVGVKKMNDDENDFIISKQELMLLGRRVESLKNQRNLFMVVFFFQTVLIMFLLGVI